VQLDTYEREMERYGGLQGIALSEQLFHADSEAVLAIVDRLAGDTGADARWRLALRGIDLLLTDLGFEAEAKHAIIKKARDGFAAEFHVDTPFKGKLGEKFRNERKSLEASLAPAWGAENPLAPGFAILRRRSAQLAPIAAALRACEQAGHLQTPLAELARSYIHMHTNRLLRSVQRAQELVLYDLLERIYESRAARVRQAGKPVSSPKPAARSGKDNVVENLALEMA
jgi:thiopeptide-type bacteriocin biosynthesis protein